MTRLLILAVIAILVLRALRHPASGGGYPYMGQAGGAGPGQQGAGGPGPGMT